MAASASAATAQTPVIGYLDACRSAVVSGDHTAFDGMRPETVLDTETLSIRGWRDQELPGLTVSLMRRGAAAVCDVSFVPRAQDSALVTRIATESAAMISQLKQDTRHRIEMRQAGELIFTCQGDRVVSTFVDPASLGQGFAAQVALVGADEMECSG